MLFTASLFLLAVSGAAHCASASRSLPQFPPLYPPTFKTPNPPTINTEFRANYMQHKYDVNVGNHIISGFVGVPEPTHRPSLTRPLE
ncbi:hypothetical protein BD779DRAFT_1681517 [Infundibulicybe gibba]|nr:hypothetical protein BD779DRAFT_1681517 [Infundibulicybe gibba]